jgi:hypothetical protein
MIKSVAFQVARRPAGGAHGRVIAVSGVAYSDGESKSRKQQRGAGNRGESVHGNPPVKFSGTLS